MISQYDEYPVHQTTEPVSHVPSTDFSWNEGYFFGVFNADLGAFFFTGIRVNPNTNMIGAYAGVNDRGHQTTVRLSRPWRLLADTSIGPYSVSFPKPLEVVRLALERNDSPLTFDVNWVAVDPPYGEPRSVIESHGRRYTDMSRYSQLGTAEGWIQLGDKRFDIGRGEWWASRAHSWGLFFAAPPLIPEARWLPPRETPPLGTGLSWVSWWGSSRNAGFFRVMSPDRERSPAGAADAPIAGGIHLDGSDEPLKVVATSHEVEFHPGTRALSRAIWHLTTEDGGEWTQEYVPVPGTWNTLTVGYGTGSWKDGGSMFTYHGVDDIVTEWDEFDFRALTYDHEMYDGTVIRDFHNAEYLCAVTTTAPDGSTSTGHGHATGG